jgi:predicted phage terminase large subunit-like protein
MLLCPEALYGGAAGGGKSDALLMAALQFVNEPGYNAILFRRSYRDLALPEALMDRASQWLGGTKAHWSAVNHAWTFPSTARLNFGYLETDQDKYSYQSAEFQFIGFDEKTQFLEGQYRYLFSRLRRLEGAYVPLRMRGASNPGNIGHDWVKRRFLPWLKCQECGIEQQVTKAEILVECPACHSKEITIRNVEGRIFIPAKLQDNPNLDRVSYIRSLNQLDPITRRQYLEGDWSAKHGGSKFRREWFISDSHPMLKAAPEDATRVRFWDMAATTPKQGKDPDYTVGSKVAFKEGMYYIEDIRRFRKTPKETEDAIKQTAVLDYMQHKNRVSICMEIEPGSEGISLVSHYSRNILSGFTFHGQRATGDKELRANPFSSAAEAGNVWLIEGVWINPFLDEAESFPLGEHDDQVDATSGAFERLRHAGPPQIMTGVRKW